ncbi:PBECR4 domain-containing protein [Streptococcus sinensis]|jgi:pcfD|uniref:PBECR4 domain-containing protein n=1 Tax=Streptococcus sinensis TaxID=176090 RepID=UPI001F40BF26|nr:PBECR4 domain-containing protein [Streptococcus sinensis]MCF1284832.1 PBECR4 domain-containing protein [Streptococcus sinensis]
MASIEELKALSILEVAESLGMSLQRTGSYTYAWEEHDSFTINVRENYFNWFARSNGGDVIKMVQVVQEELTGEKLSFKQAKHFLEEGSFDVVDVTNVPEKEPFSYYLEPYETKFIEAREYLKDVRGLSDETIDFFGEKNVLSQATKKTGDYYEPVIVFKSLDNQGEVIGASLQGIKENHDLYERGRLKQIMRASDGMTGMHVDIGTPKRLVFAEAPIDLMSYYELHKDRLEDVRLVAMDGLKESTVSRHVAELLSETGAINGDVEEAKLPTFLANMAVVTTFFHDNKHQDLITLAVDNDDAGRTFIERLEGKGIGLTQDLPPLRQDQDKMDWNDYLKESKEKALDRSQEPLNNIGGELINRNSGYLEGEPSRTAPQPEESKTQPDFPANVQLHSNMDKVSEQQKKERTYLHMGYLQPKAEGSTAPVLETSTFERSVTSRPTISSQYLHFSITDDLKSRRTRLEHSVTRHDLAKINRRGHDIQEAARFYRDELANSTISYFTSDGNVVQVNFQEKNFMHLTGLKPLGEGQTPEKTLYDFATGGELTYEDLLLSNDNSTLNKIKVLPDLKVALELNSFYFNDLQNIDRYKGRFDSLIKADDKDIMLLFRSNTEDGTVPVSVFKARKILNTELKQATKNEIIGIYRERDGVIEKIALNHEKVIDNGRAMVETLKELQKTEHVKEGSNLQNGGDLMSEKQESFLEKIERIRKEDEEKKQAEARKEELERDSDGDGIPDEVEKAQGTSPFNADTDGDGKSDQEEVSYGSNPIDSNHPNNQTQPSPEPQKSVEELIQAKDSKGLSQLLKDGVKDYFQSDTYKQYLTTMSKFHNYSPRNIQLILMQNPEASHVASFKKWKDEFERSVNKGEKALRIFAPMTLKRRDPKTNEPLLDENGNEQTFISFKLVPVFDVSQTDGKELPKTIYELEGTYEDYGNLYKSAKEVSEANGVPLSFSKDTKGSNGFYSVTNNEIVIKQGMSEQQTLKTIFHEMAHSDLHNMEKLQETPLKRSTAELQAESVAFVVASHYGLDTSEYSFGYLATWTDDPDGLSDLEGQIKIVQKEADSLISRIDKTLEKYQTKELTKDAFQEKIDRLKKQSKEKEVEPKEKEQAKDAPKKEQKSDNEMSL